MSLSAALLGLMMVGQGPIVESITLVDAARSRPIPVVLYRPAAAPGGSPRPVAILSHGFGLRNTDYSFIALHLAERGFLVASLQHEIEGDEPLPSVGKPSEVRRPSWRRGASNILFALGELAARYPDFLWSSPVLIGHSHGGDTAMLFATQHPDLVSSVISLDHRRMPVPRVAKPRILTLRSSDQVADEGVLPSAEEQEALGITVVGLSGTSHNDMCDAATPDQKAAMLAAIDRFLGLVPAAR